VSRFNRSFCLFSGISLDVQVLFVSIFQYLSQSVGSFFVGRINMLIIVGVHCFIFSVRSYDAFKKYTF